MTLNQISLYRLYFSLLGRLAPKLVIKQAFRIFHTPNCYEKNEAEIDLLSKAEHFSISFEKHTIAGYRWGKDGNPKVLIVHGWTGVATSMHCLINAFVKKEYQVVSYDAIGHGKSSGGLSTLSQWADCLRTINNFEGEVECIIAHSLGATTIFVASKLGLKTKKIVLIAPFCNPIEIIDKWFGKRLNIPAKVLEKLPKYFWDQQKEELLKYGKNWSDIFHSPYRVKTLILHDIHDKEVSKENVNVCCKQWTWAEFIQTQNLGHRRILYDEQTIDKIVRFVL